MTSNLTTTGDIQSRNVTATGSLLVGSTDILSAITNLQNNAGNYV